MDRLEPTISSDAKLLERYITALKQQHYLTYTKINHGFWEAFYFLDKINGLTQKIEDPEQARYVEKHHLYNRPYFVETGFIYEVVDLFRAMDQYDADFHFKTSLYSFPHWNALSRTHRGGEGTESLIEAYIPERFLNTNGDGLDFKTACITGEIAAFFEALRPYRIVLIGPHWFTYLGEFLQTPNTHYYPIDDQLARKDRQQILDWVQADLLIADLIPTVYMMEAGVLAFWLAATLYPQMKGKAFFFDIGQSLSLACIPRLVKTDWSLFYRSQIQRTIEQIHPGWLERNEAFILNHRGLSREALKGEWISGRVISSKTLELVPELPPLFNPPRHQSGKVDFLENKCPDYSRVQTFLSLSEKDNHWANGGPVSRLLESSLEEALQLHPDRKIVVCNSGTSAIQAMVGMENHKAGRPLRWVVSAFGFFSTYSGSLSEAIVLDCNNRGMLDLSQVEQLPDDAYDGLIITNPFGLYARFSKYETFCRDHRKRLLIDNASGLYEFNRNRADGPTESISFHHTKPWGFGEGGCVIVPREDEPIIRSLINFGVGLPEPALRYAFNGKIADPACAFILDRFERIASWGLHYHCQFWRLAHILEKMDYPGRMFFQTGPGPQFNIHTHFPLLLDDPVAMADLENPDFTVRKYYKPAPGQFPLANNLYDRIVNIPTHFDMATISEATLVAYLERIADRCRSQAKAHGGVRV